MKGKTGFSSETADRLLVDAAQVVLNYGEIAESNLGATRDGTSFNLNRTFREMPFDGMRGPTKGMKRRERIEASIACNLLEMTKTNLQLAIAGAVDYIPDPVDSDYDYIHGGPVKAGDYIDNVALVGTLSTGDDVIILIFNALPDGPLDFSTADADELVLPITFIAHFDPADYDDETGEWEEPWEIRFPVPAS